MALYRKGPLQWLGGLHSSPRSLPFAFHRPNPHAKYVNADRAAEDISWTASQLLLHRSGSRAWPHEEVALEESGLYVRVPAMRPCRHPSLCGNGAGSPRSPRTSTAAAVSSRSGTFIAPMPMTIPLPHRMPRSQGSILSPSPTAGANLRSGGFNSMSGSQAVPQYKICRTECGQRCLLSRRSISGPATNAASMYLCGSYLASPSLLEEFRLG